MTAPVELAAIDTVAPDEELAEQIVDTMLFAYSDARGLWDFWVYSRSKKFRPLPHGASERQWLIAHLLAGFGIIARAPALRYQAKFGTLAELGEMARSYQAKTREERAAYDEAIEAEYEAIGQTKQ